MGEFSCPGCKNPIYDDEALLCHFCGESLRRPSQGLIGKIKYGKPDKRLLIVVVLVVLSFIFLMLR